MFHHRNRLAFVDLFFGSWIPGFCLDAAVKNKVRIADDSSAFNNGAHSGVLSFQTKRYEA